MRKNTTKNKMQIRSSSKKEAREEFSFYIGIDLGDKNSDVCVLDQSGEVSREFRLRMKETDFRVYFASIPRSRRLGTVEVRDGHEFFPGEDHRPTCSSSKGVIRRVFSPSIYASPLAKCA